MRRHPDPIGPDRVAAVTGAASGIGRALALAMSRSGVRLALGDVDEAGLADVVNQVRSQGGVAAGQVVDVADAAEVQRWATRVADQMGAIHMVWNVAGIINAGEVLQSDLADLHRLLAVDFWGVVHGTTAFLPLIVDAGGGNVVNVSSAFGLISAPAYGGYNAAKFAVRGWTDALRQEMRLAGTGVRVTCVYPGGVRTPDHDEEHKRGGRRGRPPAARVLRDAGRPYQPRGRRGDHSSWRSGRQISCPRWSGRLHRGRANAGDGDRL